jgi:hypothetical protein
MPLKTDDKSIQDSLKLKHYKEFCLAIGAEGKAQIDSVREFREQFNSLKLPDTEEKEWLLNVTSAITRTKKNIRDSLDWALALRKELKEAGHTRLRDTISKLGSGAVEWVKAFGSNLNLVDAEKIAATLGQDNAAWVDSVPLEFRKPDLVLKCLTGITTANLTRKEIRELWKQFDGVKADALWGLMDGAPKSLCRAYRHILKLDAPGKFWMKTKDGSANKDVVARVSAIVYEDMTWDAKPIEVNGIACVLVNSLEKPWVKLFTVAQLIEIKAKLTLNPLLGKLFFPKAGDLATNHPQGAEDAAFGKWLSVHCDLVMELVHNGYTDLAIVAMFKNKFEEREIITCTWFRREAPKFGGDDVLLFKVTGVNGGVIGRRSHLAQRHLYLNFDFTDIKAKNSFHPPDTTIEDMVNIANNLKLADRNAGAKTIGAYVVCVGEENIRPESNRKPNPEKNLVVSLYPALPEHSRDYYTLSQLEGIKNVLDWVPRGNIKLPWR